VPLYEARCRRAQLLVTAELAKITLAPGGCEPLADMLP
jgi:hypothetical protein